MAKAMTLCVSNGSLEEILNTIDSARQTLQESLRDHLGLYDWNKEE